MSQLIEAIARELERARDVTGQVTRHIEGTYDIAHDDVGWFLEEELPRLEDYEHDLILSPLFTPRLAEQAVFANILGQEAVPDDRLPGIVQELTARPTRAALMTPGKKTHPVNLRAVTIERYVYRLRLNGAYSKALSALLPKIPEGDRPMLQAVARRAIWETAGRGGILESYLAAATAGGGYRLDDAISLLDLVESYKPEDAAGLLARIPAWESRLREDIDSGAGKPFFEPRIQMEHGGDRDQRRHEESRMEAKKEELAFLGRLRQVLGG